MCSTVYWSKTSVLQGTRGRLKKKTWNEVVRSKMLGCRATELGRQERLVEINHKTSLDRLG